MKKDSTREKENTMRKTKGGEEKKKDYWIWGKKPRDTPSEGKIATRERRRKRKKVGGREPKKRGGKKSCQKRKRTGERKVSAHKG